MSFFKNMSSGRNVQKYIDYDLYEESEWRIIYSENIQKRLPARKTKYFVDPRDPATGRFHEFYTSLPTDNRPEYLAPLDEWTALIIYPNLQIKNIAYEHPEVRNELKKLKCAEKSRNPQTILAEGCPSSEIANQITEIEIGAIKNF